MQYHKVSAKTRDANIIRYHQSATSVVAFIYQDADNPTASEDAIHNSVNKQLGQCLQQPIEPLNELIAVDPDLLRQVLDRITKYAQMAFLAQVTLSNGTIGLRIVDSYTSPTIQAVILPLANGTTDDQ